MRPSRSRAYGACASATAGTGGTVDALYFAAGIDDEAHGRYGKIQNVVG